MIEVFDGDWKFYAEEPKITSAVEVERCRDDICYFANKYCGVILTDEQEILLNCLGDKNTNNFIVKSPRRWGKTTIIIIDSLHKILFGSDVGAYVATLNCVHAKRVLNSIIDVYRKLPTWLQIEKPEIIKYKNRIEFSNGNFVMVDSIKSSSMRGLTLTNIYIDEFDDASIKDVDWFMDFIDHAIVCSNIKILMISSSVGNSCGCFNLMFKEALNKKNSFVPIENKGVRKHSEEDKVKEPKKKSFLDMELEIL
jgi:hypothetical protein